MEILSHQYDLICEGRKAFFDYCRTIRPQDFARNLPQFGDRSVQYLLVHIVNNYRFWVGHFAMIDNRGFQDYTPVQTMDTVQNLFLETDHMIKRFLDERKATFEEMIVNTVPMRDFKIALLPLQIFTHVITHEYHHKGQVLSMTRQMGYHPVDTDLIRF